MLKKLAPVFSLAFDTPVWKIIASPSANRLFLELRDADRHQVRFAALDLPTGQLLWQGFALDEPWWVTLAMGNDQYLLLQSFTDSHNPEEKRHLVVEVATQRVVWQSDYFQPLSLEGEQLCGYDIRDQSSDCIQLNLPEGKKQLVSSPQKKLKEKNKELYPPFFYSEDQPYFATVADFVESLGLPRPVGGCEYLEYGAYVCIAYYLPQQGTKQDELANYLLIIDQDGTILGHECLEVSVPKVGLGTFFIAQNQLIVVQHKLQLVSYDLS